LAWFIHRSTRAPWRFFFIGAVTFVVSQVFHIPFNWLVLRANIIPDDLTLWSNLLIYAIFIGLSAGVFEETTRYLSYRYWAKDCRTWSRGLMLGSGHGGIEAILLGLLAGINFIGLLYVAGNDSLLNMLPPEEQAAIHEALNTIATTPWPGLLLGFAERLFTVVTHLALSVLVLQVFARQSVKWLFLAIAYHAVFNMTAVISLIRWGPYTTESLLGLLAIVSLGLIFRLRTPEPEDHVPELPTVSESIDPQFLKPTSEVLERSRYHD
jgi:uncharacterized membrane protein YhfC